MQNNQRDLVVHGRLIFIMCFVRQFQGRTLEQKIILLLYQLGQHKGTLWDKCKDVEYEDNEPGNNRLKNISILIYSKNPHNTMPGEK